ncbi:MAG TPA: hypothetical protein DEO40_03220 [Treponema sp.]|nr:hypothetical protein [Treponema sp.]
MIINIIILPHSGIYFFSDDCLDRLKHRRMLPDKGCGGPRSGSEGMEADAGTRSSPVFAAGKNGPVCKQGSTTVQELFFSI